MTDTDDSTPQTPTGLLLELGEFHTRTCVSPLPRYPAALGWQAMAGAMAAGFTRALHALNEIAPAEAADIALWFQGPFDDGPDPMEHTDWLERNVAHGDLALMEKWVQDEMAAKSATATDAAYVAHQQNQAAAAAGRSTQ
jgi:hypothetical protein